MLDFYNISFLCCAFFRICFFRICNFLRLHNNILNTQVGCDNVHIHCESTDVAYVMSKYTDGGVDLAEAKSCLKSKCKLVDGQYVNANEA